jgi:hydrogenase maturation protease
MKDFLVIGYGNTLRRDDGAGAKVAEALSALKLPGVRTVSCHQLTPELAEPISRAREVVFVDAGVNLEAIELRELQLADDEPTMAHAANPGALLGLARRVFGRCPPAWSLGIPATDIGFGDQMSPQAEAACQQALGRIQRLAGNPAA